MNPVQSIVGTFSFMHVCVVLVAGMRVRAWVGGWLEVCACK